MVLFLLSSATAASGKTARFSQPVFRAGWRVSQVGGKRRPSEGLVGVVGQVWVVWTPTAS